ncbi:MAG: hypothetical protein HQL58_11795 [Magnetococcales bacterium]|nr:hypothetical protein [Magnetococcales bacterium]
MLENWISQQSETVTWLLIGLGGLLALIGVFKIIGSGISLLVWVMLMIVGLSCVHLGLKQQSLISIPTDMAKQLEQMIEPGKMISRDALRAMCRQLDGSGEQEPRSSRGRPAL